jgi:CheY-like chemotaxis protein
MSHRILLVEDEPLLREMTSADLTDLGFVPIVVRDGDEAIEVLERGEPVDLLITDIRMPGSRDGWELATSARALRPGLPVIYISGYSDEVQQPVAGAVFLKKPYRLREVEAALAHLGFDPQPLNG